MDGLFSPDEVSCARELIDSALSDPARAGDYRLLIAAREGALLGYICYGPTPMTQGTYDLYWLATDPAHRGQGVAGALCRAMEEELRPRGGRLVRVETSTSDGYGAAQRFYEKHGYPEACRVRDFYRPGDDLIIMIKAL
jgi:ribosomal protein S18 acetylase RimI-like enzyme